MSRFLNYTNSIIHFFIQQVEKNCFEKEQYLVYFRIFFGCFILFIVPPSWSWMSKVPNALYNPHLLSLNFFFESFPNIIFFKFAECIFYLLCFCIVFGIYSRYASIIAGIIGIICTGFVFSFGKIDHTIMLWVLFFFLPFTNAGCSMALKKDQKLSKEVQKTAIGVLGICLAFAFFSAGWQKWYNWMDLDLSTSGFLRWFYNSYFNHARTDYLADLVFYFPNWLLETMDVSAVLFEVTGFIFLLWSRKSWRLYLIIAILFHFFNLLFLNINFSFQIAVYALFILGPFWEKLHAKLLYKQTFKNIIKILIIVQTLLLIIKSIWNLHFIDFSKAFKSDDVFLIIWPVFLLLAIGILFNKPVSVSSSKNR